MTVSQFKKGQSGNPAGRKPGVENKVTKELRATLKNLIADELDRLPALMDGLEPRDRADLLIKLLKYTLPPVQPVSASSNEPMDFSM